MYGITALTDNNLSFIVGLVKEFYRYIASHSEYRDIINSDEYRQFKKANTKPRTYSSRHTGKITFTVTDTARYNQEKQTKTIDDMLLTLKHNYEHKRIVYSSLDSPFLQAFHTMQYPNLIILSAAKNNMKYLEEGLPEYIRPIEELYSPDNKVLIKYNTTRFIDSQSQIAFTYYEVFPPYIRKELKAIENYCIKYNLIRTNNNYPYVDTSTLENLLSIVPSNVYDLDMLGQFNKLLPYMKLSYKIKNSSNFLHKSINCGNFVSK